MSVSRKLNRRSVSAVAGLTLISGGLTLAWVPQDEPRAAIRLRMPTKSLDLVASETPADSAVAVSRRLYASSPAVVVATSDETTHALAIRTSDTLGTPVLMDGPSTAAEVKRLGASTVLTVGPTRTFPHARRLTPSTATREIARARKAYDLKAAGRRGVILTTRSSSVDSLAATTAENAGAQVLELPGGDPRIVPDAAKVIAAAPDAPVIALGAPSTFEYTLSAVRSGVEQFGGGYLAFPGRIMVALYGHPSSGALGVLGEQGVTASIKRVNVVAKRYRKVVKRPVVPTFEIIATVASAGAGKDKNYSAETKIKELLPLIDAAEKNGVYVILDLQPGRTHFLTQAKLYESLLKRPHVGLALDPEWRLRPKQKHLTQIGSVSVREVNKVSDWLAALTRANRLPQKVFVLHQFSITMITDRSKLDTSHPELATVIHVDGQGGQADKKGTWNYLREKAPEGVFWGWKNFYDEDEPMLTVKQTWRRVKPHPELISYQ